MSDKCPWCFDGHGVQRCHVKPDGSHVRGCVTHNGKHSADGCVFKKRDTATGRFFQLDHATPQQNEPRV